MKTKQEYITEEEKKEKYIEDVKKQLGCSYDCCLSCYTYARKNCTLRPQAEALYAAGYRKASDVIDEFVERLKEENEISFRRYGKGIGISTIFRIADEMRLSN